MASFPALCARAEDVVCAMTRWQVTEETVQSLHSLQRTLVRKAICAQVDFFAINGLDSVADTNENGFTVGKVRIGGQSGFFNTPRAKGAMASHISPMAFMYLEQSGLMNPAVPVMQGAIV